jgi:hypothetical protein
MLMLECAAGLAVSRTRCRIALPLGLITAAVMLMASMTVMHEDVHQWARRQEQPGQVRDEVRAMLCDNEKPADDGEQDEYLLHSSADDVLARLALLVHGYFLMGTERRSTGSVRASANSPPCGATK